ncbi:MAG: hypothetical protein IKK28_00065, partial [Mogibacterium sp.]|nr:hypothetical protein [Mogibacterium sp.]
MEKTKQRLIDQLGKKGFDTEKKVCAIDMQVAFDNGLADELGGILALQKAIKTHSVYAFLMDGVDTNRKRRRRLSMIMTEKPETEVKQETAIEVRSPDELRELINEIPEGTVYSIDMGVIRVGQE